MLKAKDKLRPIQKYSDADISFAEQRAKIVQSVLESVLAEHDSKRTYRVVIERCRYDFDRLPATVREGELPDNAVCVSVVYLTDLPTGPKKGTWVLRSGEELTGNYLLAFHLCYNGEAHMQYFTEQTSTREHPFRTTGFVHGLTNAMHHLAYPPRNLAR